MPVYLRKNAPMSAPSAATTDFADEDPDDFILDPEQFRDLLPQPFRMIDKVINALIDSALEIVFDREAERLREATKVRPPQYQCAVHLQENGRAGCIVGTQDGKYVIVGMSDGLAALDANTNQTIAQWREEGLDITNMQISPFGDQFYMISTLDDFGTARVFSLAGDHFYLLHTFTDHGHDNSKVIAEKCESSKGGDYIGVYFQNTVSQDGWLEVHKSPKETWMKDLESLVARVAAKRERAAAAAEGTTSPTPDVGIEYSGPSEGPAAGEEEKTSGSQRSQSPASQRGTSSPIPEKSSHKFTSTSIVLKVRPPQPITGVNWSSPYQLAKTIDGTGEVVGSGSNHQVSQQHLEQRKAMFEQLHQQHMSYLPKVADIDHVEPGFHFLLPGRLMPQGIENSQLVGTGAPTAVVVWWTGQPQVCHYSLLKPAIKDVEHKPDYVWPLSSPVVASAVSPDTSLLAFGLQNNNVVIWDKHMGLPRRVLHISDPKSLQRLQFLEPSMCPQPESRGSPYTQRTQGHLLVVCEEGRVYLTTTAGGDDSTPQAVPLNIEFESDIPTLVTPIEGMPQLLITCRRNGHVYLHDLLEAKQLCEVTLPDSHTLTSPWQPIIASGGNGQMLFIKGDMKQAPKPFYVIEEEPEDAEEDDVAPKEVSAGPTETIPSLFVFQLRSFPSLDRYRQEAAKPPVPYTVHPLAETRINALMRQRLLEQTERPARMQERWGRLKDELDTLKRLDSSANKREINLRAFPSIHA